MKFKLLLFITIVAVMLPMFSLPVLASKVVNITRPEANEVVYNEIYSIGGIGIYDHTTIEFYYKDRETEKYKILLTTDGEASFTVDKGNFFGKDIELKYKGENEIRITSYTKATRNNPKENDYTITVAEEKKNGNWFTDALDWFKKGFVENKQ